MLCWLPLLAIAYQRAPNVAAKIVQMRQILRLTDGGRSCRVRYGGWSGKGDEIATTTRSMLQAMVELSVLAATVTWPPIDELRLVLSPGGPWRAFNACRAAEVEASGPTCPGWVKPGNALIEHTISA